MGEGGGVTIRLTSKSLLFQHLYLTYYDWKMLCSTGVDGNEQV